MVWLYCRLAVLFGGPATGLSCDHVVFLCFPPHDRHGGASDHTPKTQTNAQEAKPPRTVTKSQKGAEKKK